MGLFTVDLIDGKWCQNHHELTWRYNRMKGLKIQNVTTLLTYLMHVYAELFPFNTTIFPLFYIFSQSIILMIKKGGGLLMLLMHVYSMYIGGGLIILLFQSTYVKEYFDYSLMILLIILYFIAI